MKAEIYRLFPQFFESSKNLLNNIGKNVKINVCTKKTGGFFSLHNKYYVMDNFAYGERNLLKNSDNNDRMDLCIEETGDVFMT
mgnify:CR=1 FL=1